MKSPLLASLAGLLVICACATAEAAEEVFPPGLIRFRNAHPSQMLEIYKEISRAELVMSSNVLAVDASLTYVSEKQLTRAEAMKELERTLREQAGIVITKLDDKRVSVTYNDALPLTLAPGAKAPSSSIARPILTAPDGKTYIVAPDGRTLRPLEIQARTNLPPSLLRPLPDTPPK